LFSLFRVSSDPFWTSHVHTCRAIKCCVGDSSVNSVSLLQFVESIRVHIWCSVKVVDISPCTECGVSNYRSRQITWLSELRVPVHVQREASSDTVDREALAVRVPALPRPARVQAPLHSWGCGCVYGSARAFAVVVVVVVVAMPLHLCPDMRAVGHRCACCFAWPCDGGCGDAAGRRRQRQSVMRRLRRRRLQLRWRCYGWSRPTW
jgi:hypothetical protein